MFSGNEDAWVIIYVPLKILSTKQLREARLIVIVILFFPSEMKGITGQGSIGFLTLLENLRYCE